MQIPKMTQDRLIKFTKTEHIRTKLYLFEILDRVREIQENPSP